MTEIILNSVDDIIYEPISVFREDSRYKYIVIAKFDKNKRGIDTRLYADICKEEDIDHDIDAYLIMINPGSCDEKVTTNDLIKKSYFYAGSGVVEAVSDRTQKCVMSFMATCNIKKIRILNLSDIRSGNLNKAKCLMGKNETLRKEESIFSSKRQLDREKVMPNDAVCIASWGLDNEFLGLKKQAFECLGKDRIIGVCKDEAKFAYNYIKPVKIAGQKEIIFKLSKEYLEYTSKYNAEG